MFFCFLPLGARLLNYFEPMLIVSCENAPPQYKEAQHWIDAGKRVRCAREGEKGETNNLYYSDAQIR